MIVHWGFSSWEPLRRTVASLGNYDGVHKGHQLILKQVINTAKKLSLPSVALTFDPVPRKILSPETAPPLIQTLAQRLKSLESLGIDHAIVVEFSQELAQKRPSDFVEQFLVNVLRVRVFVVGEHFSFGHQKRGDVRLLREMGERNDFLVEGIPEIHFGNMRVSSTLIRERIMKGEMQSVADLMGQPFSLTGTIVKGENVGSGLGIPTANLMVENEILPARGVYVTQAVTLAGSFPAVTNVGIRPTLGGTRLTIETHILNFSGNLYGQRMEVLFLEKLREEMKFEGLDQLKNQIMTDISRASDYHQSKAPATLTAK